MRGTPIAASGMPIAIATPQAFDSLPFHVLYDKVVRNRVHIFFGFRTYRLAKNQFHTLDWFSSTGSNKTQHEPQKAY